MPLVWEIVIRGKFVAGTTIDDQEQAKKTCQELLLSRLVAAGVTDPDGFGVFKWVLESIEASHYKGS